MVTYNQDSIPSINQCVIDIATEYLGETVGRGECWDLAALALNHCHADWDGVFGFGVSLDEKDKLGCPGDIIQFKGVKLKYKDGSKVYTETMEQHTAIIYEVNNNSYTLIHQNIGKHGKKVGLSDFNPEDLVNGSYIIYRPKAKK